MSDTTPNSSLLGASSIWDSWNRETPLGEVIAAQLRAWPDHEKFLRKSFALREGRLVESSYRTAELVLQMIGSKLQEHAESYQWMCEAVNQEVKHFFTTGQYRHKSFLEVHDGIYGNPAYMTRYMQGLLLSLIHWTNHASVVDTYANDFLAGLPDHSRCLEIGPGHGLFCALAAGHPRVASVDAWDLSPSSLEMTKGNLTKLGFEDRVHLHIRDVTEELGDREGRPFDGIVISEVLEHLEDPAAVLRGVRRHLAPEGKVFINVPVNSPAPDHIFLLNNPEQARRLVLDSGLEIESFKDFPATGHSLEGARKARLTISCVIVALPGTRDEK